ncbi:RimK family alpha-L-glutamate ligase [Calidifontimicrobium sp. SYSU G02091]|uniref:ATP-grasp domain-containing protein n=1 Tax=Calidifontimicrobium sp. SYSU G02091 TaxID=2926421 RepID=UPI001F52FFA6|nr:RimK family alpha-L-glutamate ligase [Calidifontimicrobium sp. SYSU G02091]MCI1192564.1 RimK family alpha-L-glutamate ligase [Calidifontimicrobium sp. SYSU G02091]
MRVAIASDESGWHTRRLLAALRARGADGRTFDLAQARLDTTHAGHGLVLPGFGRELPDAVFVRGIAGGSFEQVTRRLAVLHALQALGVPVYNDARAIERSVDKSMTTLLLHAAGLPTPPTWALESPQLAQRLVMRESAAGHSLVLKPLFGSQGKGLQRVGWVVDDEYPQGRHVPLPALDAGFGGVAYLQRFVPARTRPGHDWRVLVVGGVARAAMRRFGRHWIHNVAQGARCEPQPLDRGDGPRLARLAEAATHTLGLDYAGVDLMPGDDGPLVIEVNGVAAWQGLQRVTAGDIAGWLVDDLLGRKCAAAARRLRA